jgi:hypothetical protein
MSTVSGFVLGVVVASTLTIVYGQRLSSSLRDAVARHQPGTGLAELVELAGDGRAATKTSGRIQSLHSPAVVAHVEDAVTSVPAEPTLEQRWAEYAARATTLEPAGEFPWRTCFTRAAASYELPESLLLAIASGESNFDPAARSDKNAVGLMQIRWPDTSRHLGVRREADLYDPCTNVDAGARYLVELAAQFDNNLHLVVAAYNYGPGRIAAGQVPDGARWYSHYIYQHLQQVLGAKHVATSELIPPADLSAGGFQLLMRFNRSRRARDFKSYIEGQLPDLELRQRSEALGQHDVVLLYRDEAQRLHALSLISAAGIATLQPQPRNKQTL